MVASSQTATLALTRHKLNHAAAPALVAPRPLGYAHGPMLPGHEAALTL